MVIAYGKLVAFIATLAMLAAARGLAEIIANRRTQIVQDQDFLDFFSGDVLGIPTLVIIFALVAVAGWVLLNRTTFGRRTFAVGGNAEAARLAGIRVQRHTVKLYVLSGVTCGIAAVMLMARTTTGSSTHGTLYELDAIAAVVIGGTLLIGGRGTIVGTVLGVLIFTTLSNVFTLNDLSSSAQAVAKGVIIVLAVLLQMRLATGEGVGRRARSGPAAGVSAPGGPGGAAGGGSASPRRPRRRPTRRRRASPRPDPRDGSAPPGRPPGPPVAAPDDSTTDHLATAPGRRYRGENMSATRQRGYRRLTSTAVALIGAGALVAGCTGNTPESSGGDGGGNNAASDNDETGDTVVIGFSAPAADHGWIAGITEAARAEAEKYDDIDLRVAEGTNDVSTQISQVETFINDGVDAIVLLPFDGAALTPVALQAMEAGIPVINVDREFDDPVASRATILGDNYGMGVSAGTYICSRLEGQTPTPSSPRSPASTRCP